MATLSAEDVARARTLFDCLGIEERGVKMNATHLAYALRIMGLHPTEDYIAQMGDRYNSSDVKLTFDDFRLICTQVKAEREKILKLVSRIKLKK